MQRKYISLILLWLPLATLAQAQTLIGEQTFRFKDTLRNRPLTTEIWYPTTDSSRHRKRIILL